MRFWASLPIEAVAEIFFEPGTPQKQEFGSILNVKTSHVLLQLTPSHRSHFDVTSLHVCQRAMGTQDQQMKTNVKKGGHDFGTLMGIEYPSPVSDPVSTKRTKTDSCVRYVISTQRLLCDG